MLTHEQIMACTVTQNEDGTVFCIFSGFIGNGKGLLANKFTPIYTPQTVHPDFVNVLAASILMYQHLTQEKEKLEGELKVAEREGYENVMRDRIARSANITMTQRIAVEGIYEVLSNNPQNTTLDG